MRHMLVVCEDDMPFETHIEDGSRLRITGSGNLRLIPADGRSSVKRMESLAKVVYELFEEPQS